MSLIDRENLDAVAEVLKSAKCPEDVFGPMADAAALTKAWHRLAAAVHPDKFVSAPMAEFHNASSLFAQINVWKVQAEKKIQAGTYGDGSVHVDPPERAPSVIETKTHRYALGDRIAVGDICDLYACSFDGGPPSVLKIVQSSADNDLLDAETKALQKLKGDSGFHRFIPTLYDSFTLRGTSGKPRRVNVIRRAGEYVSIADIQKRYPAPTGLDFRDMAWMFKRLLSAIGFAHREGIVHAAILAPHVLVHPTKHGCKLLDWCYSVPMGGRVVAISKSYRSFYPSEILDKKPVNAQTDVFMAAQCVQSLLGTTAPKPIVSFLTSCTLAKQSARPDDAWALYVEFDELLRKLVGRPTYRPLSM